MGTAMDVKSLSTVMPDTFTPSGEKANALGDGGVKRIFLDPLWERIEVTETKVRDERIPGDGGKTSLKRAARRLTESLNLTQ